ncbi:MAG: hypothetical protein SP4CHLAM5_07910 [Chlamydiia bacterium]|nr:hypothetical protein [Chlamydiia bacterium]MCH9618655.1 hypothetical protein [Chlamydiia bacterium]MCH9623846.1 hypothetical protein [Chlamydiia bacterium]
MPITLEEGTGGISGSVTDQSSSLGIAGALIQASKNNVIINTAITDINGAYSITGLDPESYTMIASAENYSLSMLGSEVTADTITNEHFVLQDGGSLTGTITDPDSGAGISGAVVKIVSNNTIVQEDVTTSDGVYIFSGLSADSYIIAASADGYGNNTKSVQIQVDQQESVDIALKDTSGGVSGKVIDADTLLALPGATLEYRQGSVVLGSALTNSEGDYIIHNLFPGTYTVVALETGYITKIHTVQITSDTTSVLNFALGKGSGSFIGKITDAATTEAIAGAQVEVLQDNVIINSAITDNAGDYIIEGLASEGYTIQASAANYGEKSVSAAAIVSVPVTVNIALGNGGGTIEGKISSESSYISGATVDLYQNNILIKSTLTDEQGDYVLSEIDPGTYTISAFAATYIRASEQVQVGVDAQLTVNMTLSSDPASITGLVEDSGSSPLKNAIVQLLKDKVLITSAVTDQSGEYTIDGIDSGAYLLITGKTGYQYAHKTVDVQAGSATTENFTLENDANSVVGTILQGNTTNGIANAFVEICDQESGFYLSMYSMSDGSYSFSGLYPGTYKVDASKTGYFTNYTPPFTIDAISMTTETEDLPLYADDPPIHLVGSVNNIRYLLQSDRIHKLVWEESVSPDVTHYNIYKNGSLVGSVLATSPVLEYEDHNNSPRKVVEYMVRSVNPDGSESSGVTVSLQ